MRAIAIALGLVCTLGPGFAAKVEVPKPQPPVHSGVGRMIPALTGKTLAGAEWNSAEELKGKKGIAFAVTSSSCPLSKKFAPTLAALEKEFAAKGIAFVYLAPIESDSVEDLKELAAGAGFNGPILKGTELPAALGVRTTTEFLLVDSKSSVSYRGAVDDQYGLNYSTDAPKHTYAKDALTALLAGKEPVFRATTAPGCELDLKPAKAAVEKVEFNNRISRIIQQNCQDCHRKGGAGPFVLETSKDVTSHKAVIKKVIEGGTMPPWNAEPEKAKSHVKTFKNDRSIPEQDKADLFAWFEAGAPEGNAADAPLPRPYSTDWVIGKPDLVLQLPKEIQVKATGVMEYIEVIVDTELAEDKYVVAAEIQPSDKSVVHHVLCFALPPKKPGEFEVPKRGEGQGYFAAYVPGNSHQILPDGFGRKLQKGARIKFQLHFTPNGKATTDQCKVAFKFAEKPPANEIRVFPLGNPKIEIPPGDSNHKEIAEYKLPIDANVTAFSPHMHVRGKAAKYEAELPNGDIKELLMVPHYDFNWQLRYELAEPAVFPKGTILRYTAWYDNSDGNPSNPNPKKTVKWGDQTYDEMMLGYIEFYMPALAKKK